MRYRLSKDSVNVNVLFLCWRFVRMPGSTVKKKVNQSHYRPEVPRGFQEVNVPRLRDNGPG